MPRRWVAWSPAVADDGFGGVKSVPVVRRRWSTGSWKREGASSFGLVRQGVGSAACASRARPGEGYAGTRVYRQHELEWLGSMSTTLGKSQQYLGG
jgi:hypothetical protein